MTLENRDFTLIIDASGSMGEEDQHDGKSRWQAAEEGTLAIARKIQKMDADGITVYTFSNSYRRFDNVTDGTVKRIFQEVEPNGSTNLSFVLDAAFTDYFKRKRTGQAKANGELIIVITDGEPDSAIAVKDVLIRATHVMERDEELGVLFIQIGKDARARAFLKSLDDDLLAKEKGAKFDIVDAITMDEVGDRSLVEVLEAAIND
jgi:Mg-chelatase subunit ChlD